MNENPYVSPAETVETLAKEVLPWREFPPKMAWAKWGMVWIAVSIVWLVGGFSFISTKDWVVEVFVGIHAIGVIFCCLCPKSVVKWRWQLVGWSSVLLFAVFFLGTQLPFRMMRYAAWGDWPSMALGAGIWLWLLFVLILSLRIRSWLCAWLAWGVFMSDTLVCVSETMFIHHGCIRYVIGDYALMLILSSFVAYSLLIICLWWRIHRMLRAGRKEKSAS